MNKHVHGLKHYKPVQQLPKDVTLSNAMRVDCGLLLTISNKLQFSLLC